MGIQFFAEDLEAVKDVWLVGDKFLRSVYPSLVAMLRESQITNDKLYLYQYFNVRSYFLENECSTNALLRIQNAFIHAINKNKRLPRFIIIFTDDDLMKSMGKKYADYGMGRAIGKLIDKVTSFVDRVTSTKRTDMYYRKPGSICASEPKFVWVKMIERYNKDENVFQALRQKYNSLLEEAIAPRRHNYIVDVSKKVNKTAFDRNGELNVTGVINFWLELDKQIELFDKQQITLKPMGTTTGMRNANPQSAKGSGDYHSRK